MAYGVKFELFFQDVEERRFKVEILKKGYSGTVKSLVGFWKSRGNNLGRERRYLFANNWLTLHIEFDGNRNNRL